MAKPELGLKRQCMSCGAKFYDLNKDPAVCPKCGTVFQASALARVPAPVVARAAPAADDDEAEIETTGPEMVSLDEVEAAEADKDLPGEDDIDVGDDVADEETRSWRRRRRARTTSPTSSTATSRTTKRLESAIRPDYRDALRSGGDLIPRSIPTPRPAWGHSSVGRALEWHSRGRRFEFRLAPPEFLLFNCGLEVSHLERLR